MGEASGNVDRLAPQPHGLARQGVERVIELRLGEAYLFSRDAANAEPWFNAGIDNDAPDRVLAALYLRRGMSLDRLSRRDDAKKDYQIVLELDVDKAINRTAKRYMKKPYR